MSDVVVLRGFSSTPRLVALRDGALSQQEYTNMSDNNNNNTTTRLATVTTNDDGSMNITLTPAPYRLVAGAEETIVIGDAESALVDVVVLSTFAVYPNGGIEYRIEASNGERHTIWEPRDDNAARTRCTAHFLGFVNALTARTMDALEVERAGRTTVDLTQFDLTDAETNFWTAGIERVESTYTSACSSLSEVLQRIEDHMADAEEHAEKCSRYADMANDRATSIARRLREAFENTPEAWRTSEDGNAALDMVDRWESFSVEVPDAPSFNGTRFDNVEEWAPDSDLDMQTPPLTLDDAR